MISSPDYEAYKADLDKIQGASGNNGMADSSSRTIAQMVRDAAENARVRAEENKKHIIDNTFQYNPDGTNYGVGTDGKTYSYTMFNNRVKDIKPLSVDDQKKAISDLSLGRVRVDDSITEPGYLTQIHRSLKRMLDYDNGNVIPDNVTIGDPDPDDFYYLRGLLGQAKLGHTSWENGTEPDTIEYYGTNSRYSDLLSDLLKKNAESGHGVGRVDNKTDDITQTHELAHTADFATKFTEDRWRDEKVRESYKYDNEYSIDDLIRLAVKNFFGAGLDKEQELTSVGEKMRKDIYKKANEMEYADTHNIMEKVAKKLGYKNSIEALEDVSEYALSTEWEAFAEIYTDVLLNGENASPFSKEVMKEYSKIADDLAKKTGKNAEFTKKRMNDFFSVPDVTKGDLLTDLKRTRQIINRTK